MSICLKKTLKLFFVMLLFSCKGEPAKKEESNDSIDARKAVVKTPADQTVENCYDYLTELVRSSNFPFSEWKIDKKKVNLLIDDDNEEVISCQLIIDTEGSGTIGWIEYRKKDGRLMNTSANLEQPAELKYDTKWKDLFDSCASRY
ncbi:MULTISPECIES: hypothetical protein [Chryseobacterium]|uniref:Lipoprotein n=1 Tax=Chryseobacterium camelliae TaxID=1265445 RepID=A0ABU0TJK8_9FLAO|nr:MULTISPECIES: hypothetical protein [Chryseobacterium]MDT3408915.1 hypothetical protein [Pseudacidovorax intermedius]MDQ1097228.1 hypothetical protein [Chryseobacterium camelliae]MDQ1101163.1 hypothetical protein [Chryseobacterium sp. SORGH_AS_1048]MDR6084608.1 hypothetical protein [Chryseobacterium sp. SORGH_AS_0909]MDR6132880.1 hypothetical protein [Chryseobacterium sp. SORGH_AS_1175]